MLKISIITVCFNNKDTLEHTIKSVVSQAYPSMEYIVIDGGSTDGTLDIINKYRDKISVVVSEKDEGMYFAINKGIEKATGDIIGILHGDDFYVNAEIIPRIVHAFDASGNECVYGDLQFVKRDDLDKITRTWIAGEYADNLFLKGWMPPHPTFFLKKECYEKFGLYNTELKLAADYELMLRMLYKYKLRAYYLPEILVKMRTGGASNKSIFNRIKNNIEDRKAWKINELKPSFFTLFIKPLSKIGQFFS